MKNLFDKIRKMNLSDICSEYNINLMPSQKDAIINILYNVDSHNFIGKRGGLSTYIGGKRITGGKTINHYNR
jgi:hypothetical protein